MRILTNELKSAKLLRQAGFSPKKSEAFMSMISTMEIHNLYSSDEIDIMLSDAVEKVFAKQNEMLKEQRREFDEKFNQRRTESLETRRDQRRELEARLDMAQKESRETRQEQRHEFDARMDLLKVQIDKDYDELKASRRWVVGTIITVGMGLAAYLSALIKLSH